MFVCVLPRHLSSVRDDNYPLWDIYVPGIIMYQQTEKIFPDPGNVFESQEINLLWHTFLVMLGYHVWGDLQFNLIAIQRKNYLPICAKNPIINL